MTVAAPTASSTFSTEMSTRPAPSLYTRASKFTRRNGCALASADETGATTDRPSYASGPESHRSLDGEPGSEAV
ncbi:MAG: hypothetical protein DMF93_18350 [Acidobacteria bacterium]|nr:MAG: hypothetical protein DMF93_18350 [Acidobacteriota bacterium]